MRFVGTLKTWNDDRGFGFIEPAQGGQEVFVHIKAFPAGTGRPAVGQTLTFEVETGPDRKKRARSVQYPARSRGAKPPRLERPARWTWPRLVALPAFGAVCFAIATHWSLDRHVLPFYLGASVVAFLAYGFDKAAARERRWRTPEATLHVLGLVGGWPGALLAQQLMRHKTSKPSFVAAFWATVVVNVTALVVWHAVQRRLL